MRGVGLDLGVRGLVSGVSVTLGQQDARLQAVETTSRQIRRPWVTATIDLTPGPDRSTEYDPGGHAILGERRLRVGRR